MLHNVILRRRLWRRMLRSAILALLLVAPVAWAVTPIPPNGGGPTDPWLDAAGDTLFGDLQVGGYNLTFGGNTLAESSGFRYNGSLVCIQDVVSCGAIAEQDCGTGSVVRWIDDESSLGCVDDDDSPFGTTVVVPGTLSPSANGQALRYAFDALALPAVVLLEPGEYDIGDEPLVVPSGVILRGAGDASTIVGSPEYGRAVHLDFGAGGIYDLHVRAVGGTCEALGVVGDWTGDGIRITMGSGETCTGLRIYEGATLRLGHAITSHDGTSNTVVLADVHGDLEFEGFEANTETAAATVTGLHLGPTGVARGVSFQARITTSFSGLGADLEPGSIFRSDRFSATVSVAGLQGGQVFGVRALGEAHLGEVDIQGDGTTDADVTGLLIGGTSTIRGGAVDVRFGASVTALRVTADAKAVLGSVSLAAEEGALARSAYVAPGATFTLTNGEVLARASVGGIAVGVESHGLGVIRDTDVTALSDADASGVVVSQGRFELTNTRLTVESVGGIARALEADGEVSFTGTISTTSSGDATGIRIGPAGIGTFRDTHMIATGSYDQAIGSLRGVVVEQEGEVAFGGSISVSGGLTSTGVEVAQAGRAEINGARVEVKTSLAGTSAVAIRSRGVLVVDGTTAFASSPIVPGVLVADKGTASIVRSSLNGQGGSDTVAVLIGNLANATLRATTIFANATTNATGLRAMGPHIAMEEGFVEAKAQNGRAVHAELGNLTIDGSRLFGSSRSIESGGPSFVRIFLSRLGGGSALVASGQCAGNVDRFGNFLQNGCNL